MIQFGSGSNYSVSMAGPFANGGSAIKYVEISLPVDSWKGGESPYFQEVQVDGISVNSMVNLHPAPDSITECTAFSAVNDAGVVTVWATGVKPQTDYTFWATLQEVSAQ